MGIEWIQPEDVVPLALLIDDSIQTSTSVAETTIQKTRILLLRRATM